MPKIRRFSQEVQVAATDVARLSSTSNTIDVKDYGVHGEVRTTLSSMKGCIKKLDSGALTCRTYEQSYTVRGYLLPPVNENHIISFYLSHCLLDIPQHCKDIVKIHEQAPQRQLHHRTICTSVKPESQNQEVFLALL